PADVESFHRLRADPTDSRNPRNEIRRRLGAGGNLELQIAPERSPVFHAERSTRSDLMRDLARHHAAAATTPGRWRTGAGLRHRHSFRGTGEISVEGRDSSAARSRFA